MATPPAYDHLDPSVKRYVDMAEAVGWQVKPSSKAVSVITPTGARISLPLKPTSQLLQVAEAQARSNGLYDAFEARERELAEAALERELAGLPAEPAPAADPQPEPEPEQTGEPKADEEHICPDCGQGPFASVAGLGKHRNAVHGVRGATQARISKIDPEALGGLQTAFDLFEHELLTTLRGLTANTGGDPERERELEQEAKEASRAAEKAAKALQVAQTQVRELRAEVRSHERFRAAVKKALHENTPLALAGAIAALDPEFFTS